MPFRSAPSPRADKSRKPGLAHPPEQAQPVQGGTIAPEAIQVEVDRILASEAFRYSERLSRFLKFVVEQRLAGHADQLKESVLAVEIFDRSASYDSRVDSVVRVEARRVREKLDKYYAGEGQVDPVLIALPKGSYAPTFSLRSAPTAPNVAPESVRAAIGPKLRQLPVGIAAAIALLSVLATMAVTRWFGSDPLPAPTLRRLTSEAGLTFQPALSGDGKLLAFSSDRSGSGHLDIWVQQVPGGTAHRLTENAGDEIEPTFSPDGTLIAYRADGANDGIYVLPALGGAGTLLAPGGYRPRFSPNGAHIAYWDGERTFWSAKMFVVPVVGGSPVQLQPEFRYAAYPVWSPDGKHVLFVGSKDPKGRDWDSYSEDWDWWVAPASGGSATGTAARKAFAEQGLRPRLTNWSHRRIVPYVWTESGHVVFPARTGDRINLWRIPISRGTWQITGPAEQLTFGTGREDHPSLANNGSLVFSVLTHKADVWSLPIHADSGEPRGSLARITSDAFNYMRPVVSRDGTRLAFLTNRAGNYDVWAHDFAGGGERALTTTRQDESAATLSPDGSTVAFAQYPNSEAVFEVPFGGGPVKEACAECGEPRAWLSGNSGLVYQRVSPSGESVVGVVQGSREPAPLLQSYESALFSPSISADGKWMALVVRTPPSDHRIAIVPLRGASAAARPDWIWAVEPGSWVDKPRWSPSGNMIYFASDRDGFFCIWVQPLDAVTKKPMGGPKAVMHFHGRRRSMASVSGLELSVAVDKLVFNLGEESGDVWLAPSGR